MNRFSAMLAVCFCAGLLGALVSSLCSWQLDVLGVPGLLDVRWHIDMNKGWLYQRMIWGGLWGLAYFITVGPRNAQRHWARKGLWVSLLPSAFQLLVVFPYMTKYGWLGFSLGQLVPLLVLIDNLIWGFATGIFCRLLWGRRR